MAVKPTQKKRVISASSPLGKDVLLFRSMSGTEELGRLFEYDLTLYSEDPSIPPDDIVGQGLTVSVELPSGGTRYYNGIVTRFSQAMSQGNYSVYQATLRPWFWLLSRHADCKIFQEKTVPDIIKEVFRDSGFTDFDDKLTGAYRQWDYCVQYRESDFNFVSRLMEQEGFYYYFKHEDGKHTLVLCDDYGSHEPFPGYDTIPYYPPNSRREEERIDNWLLSQEVQTGTYVLEDFDFERPKADLLVKDVVTRQHAHSNFEVYDYPGEYLQTGDGNTYATVRIQEQQCQHERVEGSCDARGMATGALFEMTGFPRDDQNREYLVTSAAYELRSNEYETSTAAAEEEVYRCNFAAIDSREPFRARRLTPVPLIRGPQTAIVVGKSGEEIWTDKYGRVKVQFHWDRYGKLDENSSCWVRVAQVWAGKTWGGIQIPRIGQEVIVEFLEGDPDRPIITGRVYNADQMPPYVLPDNQTQSGMKTRSTKSGDGKTFNELRFEDKKGEEEVYFHAEKNFNRVVENDDTLEVGFEDKDKGDQSIKIYNDQTVEIGLGSKGGSQTVKIHKDRTTTLETGNEKLQVKKGKRDTLIDTGNDTLKIAKGNRTVKLDMGKIAEEAMQSIELKVGSNSIKIDQSGITIKGIMVKIEGTATVEAKSPMTTVKGDGMLTLKGGVIMIN